MEIDCSFQNEALTVIWDEVKLMKKEERYIGVQFEYGFRGISVLYASPGCLMTQTQLYHFRFWEDICFAMAVLQRITSVLGYKDAVQRSEDQAHSRLWWGIYLSEIKDSTLPSLEVLLTRVDKAMLLVDREFDAPEQQVYKCPNPGCGATMVQTDGGDDMYCPECQS